MPSIARSAAASRPKGLAPRSTWTVAIAALLLGGCAASGDLGNGGTRGVPPSTASITPVDRQALATLDGSAGNGSATDPSSQSNASNATTDSAKPGDGLKVALLLPTGSIDQTAVIAKAMKQAAEMALFDSQRSDVQLIVKDDKGTPEGAKAAAEEAIKDGAEVILGPLLSRAVPGAAAAAASANVPILAFSNDRTVAGRGVYLLGFSPEQDAERVAEYAARLGKTRFAALVPDDAYGKVIGDAFKAAVTKAGGSILAYETYPAGANAMIGPSRRIVEAAKTAVGNGAPIDALFLPGGQDVLTQLGPLLTYSGFDGGKIKLLGSGAWEFATISTNEAFVGGWYPGPDPHGWRDFQGRYAKTFGHPPPRVATIAYDAMNLAISLSAEPKGQRFTAANLTRASGFASVDGTLRLTATGYADRGLAILEVQKVGSTIIDPAPASIDGARFSGQPTRIN